MATPILMPRQGQSVESCILTSWNVKEGDAVTTGHIVATIETDKASFEVESPGDGVILGLFFEEGDDIPVLTTIAAVGEAGENIDDLRPGGSAPAADKPKSAAASEAAPSPTPSAPAPAAAPAAPAGGTSGISPRARKAAASSGVDASALTGSGPGGRVIERDVKAAAAAGPRLTAAARAAVSQGSGFAPAQGGGLAGMVRSGDLGASAPAQAAAVRPDREIPVKGVRKIVAERMRASLSGTAQLTLNMRFDATVMQSLRARIKDHGEAYGLPKLTINDLICYAVVRTLADHPALNAHFLGNRIVEFGSVNLGVAVDTPRGLMVPVVHGASSMSMAALSQAIRERATSAQQGSINPDLLAGGTFTVTNLGITGVEYFTPVLNAPEVAILGVGGPTLQPVRRNGTIEYADMIGLSLTVDHQAVDGAPAARFLQELCRALENIDLIMAG